MDGQTVAILTNEEASGTTSNLLTENTTTESLNFSLDENMTWRDICVDSSEFICGNYAHAISGVFAFSALFMACFQVT